MFGYFYMKIALINFPPSSGSSRLLIEFAAFDFIYCVYEISMMCYLQCSVQNAGE